MEGGGGGAASSPASLLPSHAGTHTHTLTTRATPNRPTRARLVPRQVTGQPDGARLLLSLESKRADSLPSAAAALRELLPPGSLLGEQSDVRRLTTSQDG